MEIIKSFSIEEINSQLHRILDSTVFQNSPTLTRFLSFIVTETIHGKQHHIKEYSIAINVLNRQPDFNPHDDAVVRIHAGRLRRALNEYYLTKGIHDPIIIQIPKGGYIPQFEVGQTEKVVEVRLKVLAEHRAKPVVAVYPIHVFSQRKEILEFSSILEEQFSAELSRFKEITVIGYYSEEMKTKIEQNVLEAGKSIGADYIIVCSLQYRNQLLRIMANLLITATGEVIMIKSFEKQILASDLYKIQDEIVQAVISAVGGYYGIIFQEIEKHLALEDSDSTGIRECINNYYRYQRIYSIGNYNKALSSLQNIVKVHSDHAVAWAMLGELYLDGIALGKTKGDDPMSQAFRCVMESLRIDPHCQQAWHTLTLVHLFKKDKTACREAALQCIQLNPNCSEIVSGVAIMLICAGYYEEGFQILEKAVKLNLHHSWWINGGFSIYYLHKKEYDKALTWAEKMNAEETFWNPLLKCVALFYLNKKQAARKQLTKLLLLQPSLSENIRTLLSNFLLNDELIEHIISGLEKTGLNEINEHSPKDKPPVVFS